MLITKNKPLLTCQAQILCLLIYKAQNHCYIAQWKNVLIYQAQTLSQLTKHKPCDNLQSPNPLLTYQAQSLC